MFNTLGVLLTFIVHTYVVEYRMMIIGMIYIRVGLFFQKLSDHSLQLPKVEHFDKIESHVLRIGLSFTKKVLKPKEILQNH